MEKTLMHTCCAPCSVSCIQQLRSEGIEPVAYWYNPNIHPYQEYKVRRDTLMAYAPTIGMELLCPRPAPPAGRCSHTHSGWEQGYSSGR